MCCEQFRLARDDSNYLAIFISLERQAVVARPSRNRFRVSSHLLDSRQLLECKIVRMEEVSGHLPFPCPRMMYVFCDGARKDLAEISLKSLVL